MHEADEEDKTYSETSLSLLNTPDVSRMSERAMFGNKIGQRATTPIKIPSGSLLRIDERKSQTKFCLLEKVLAGLIQQICKPGLPGIV